MKQDFEVSIESFHLPGKGELQNVHRLTPDQLAQREVIMVDIAGELLENNDYVKEEDPTKFSSTKTGRGPLTPGWANRQRAEAQLRGCSTRD
ncbi:unnamed protein product [Orchesella dallaii]|uniref:Phosphatidylinositol transfer protein N-terminal domain-containing protein n=1 Tax=Orchesella dallaii TaxID=48710 RepID=A0ABP1PRQ1_9HEXA